MKLTTVKKNKTLNIWSLTLGLAAAVMLSPHNAVATGNNLMQFSSKTSMINTGVDPNASGKVNVTLSRQGNANHQQLDISLANLDANTAYQLVAFLGDDTNTSFMVGFTTDTKGGFLVSYVKRNEGNSNPRGELFRDTLDPLSIFHKAKPLPNALDPLCDVRELDIVNTNMETVLQAVLTSPDKGNYLVRRSMNHTGFLPAAIGELFIQADPHSTRFQLQSSGLTPFANYHLVINENIAPASMSDRFGKLTLTNLPAGSSNVLDIQTVALTDATSTNIVLITGGLGIPCSSANQAPLVLGAAANFAVLAGSTVANTGLTTVKGNLGLSPGSAVTGFPPGIVNGNEFVADTTADQAKLDLTTAYNDAAGRTVAPVTIAGNIGGMTLAPGLYKSTSSLEISSGDLTLDAQGDANAVFIFQIASTLTTTAGRQVILSGGAKAANIFWQVGTSATLGTTSVFKGTIMADQSITLTTGATLEGRALTRVAAVILQANVITIPAP